MGTALTVAWLLLLSFNATVLIYVAPLMGPLHSLCLASVPNDTEFHDWISAIVCASHANAALGAADLQNLGLIHLVIVSGTQLIFIERACRYAFQTFGRWRPWPPRVSDIALVCALTFYAALTALPIPLLRALLQFGFRRFSMRAKLFWRPAQLTLLAGLCTLICAPLLANPLSLQFGWLASLVFNGPLSKRALISWTSLGRQVLLYTVLVIPLLPIGLPHPVSVLCNWILVPVMSFILFPLSVATVLVHALSPLTDFVWRQFFETLSSITDWATPLDLRLQLPPVLGWIYLLAVQIFYLYRERDPCVD